MTAIQLVLTDVQPLARQNCTLPAQEPGHQAAIRSAGMGLKLGLKHVMTKTQIISMDAIVLASLNRVTLALELFALLFAETL